jgi:hypothetical protein
LLEAAKSFKSQLDSMCWAIFDRNLEYQQLIDPRNSTAYNDASDHLKPA